MRNISVFVKNLNMSQNSFYMIKELNKCIQDVSLSAGVIYQEKSVPPVPTLFSCKMINGLSSFKGTLIATTIEDAGIMLQINAKSDLFLYLWDMPWIESPVNFEHATGIMRDPRIHIIARSESHADCIENFCNKRPIGTVDNWDLESLLEITK